MENGFGDGDLIEDGRPSPALRARASVVAAGYVDNFATVGGDARAVTAMRDQVTRLPVHSIGEASSISVFTGLEINGDLGAVRAKPSSILRHRQAIFGGSAARGCVASHARSFAGAHHVGHDLQKRDPIHPVLGLRLQIFEGPYGDTPVELHQVRALVRGQHATSLDVAHEYSSGYACFGFGRFSDRYRRMYSAAGSAPGGRDWEAGGEVEVSMHVSGVCTG